MHSIKIGIFIILCYSFSAKVFAQDSTNLMTDLINESKGSTTYTKSTFDYTRVVDGHSVETQPQGVLDLRISHRFGPVNSGLYNLFGLDNATMRLGFDYGITNQLMIGVGHSTYKKTYDGFLKLKLLKQSEGEVNMPVTVSILAAFSTNTLRMPDSLKTTFGDRTATVFQLLIARKISDGFSFQLMPTYIHADNISFNHPKKDILALGAAARQRLSKRVSITGEYYYQFTDSKSPSSNNVLSFGFDIDTGGHVFQLHFTNSIGLNEKTFISETTGRWDKGDVLFGFNISRVFQLNRK
ncbi:MAG: DUF5777 family beta-barrel protein [Ginsengibacter sp.]